MQLLMPNISIPNVEGVATSLRNKTDKMRRQIRSAIRRAGDRIAQEARARAPRKTGRLQASIRTKVQNLGSYTFRTIVEPNPSAGGWRGAFFEYRQRSEFADVRWRTVNGIPVRLQKSYKRRVNLHYRPFMQPAYLALKDQVIADLQNEINQVVRS